jgi:hypothetical protein
MRGLGLGWTRWVGDLMQIVRVMVMVMVMAANRREKD